MNFSSSIEDRLRTKYDEISLEYYDPSRHPTCADLGTLSRKIIVPILHEIMPPTGTLVEIGAGLSTLAGVAKTFDALTRVVLIDSSQKMLEYSANWLSVGARSLVASASATGLPADSASLIVSSLGDPYNNRAFWMEAARLLAPGGVCVFSTPSFEWSSTFRKENEMTSAEFLVASGTRVLVPSFIRTFDDQLEMISSVGLDFIEYAALGTAALKDRPAPKLLCVGPDTPVVAVYVIRKPMHSAPE